MDNTSYVSLSNQLALQRRMDITANNIANMNTVGFKTEHSVFEDYLVKPEPSERKAAYNFVSDIGMYRSFDDGAHTFTSNDLDVALTGPGFLQVENDAGDLFYTRNGQMSVNSLGTLVDTNGHAVLDNGGTPITIPAGTEQVSIGKDGTVATEEGVVGTLGVFEFANLQDMQKSGDNLYTTTQNPELATQTVVSQGYIEGSNVNPIIEMQNMISLQRMYEATQRMVEQEHDRKTNYIQRLGRSSS